jgi:CRISPR-associated protein Csh2
MSDNNLKKSEILFLYESKYSEPNGDPYTGEQRYDEETKKILVSDVRIKRFIRDYLDTKGFEIFLKPAKPEEVKPDTADTAKKDSESGAAKRVQELKKNPKYKDVKDTKTLLQKCIDVRLFGGIDTTKGSNLHLTGPVQFALLNPSLNSQNLRPHQNTSHFVSRTENKQGAIATKSIVPYGLNQIHGWVNPLSAKETELTADNVETMFSALWHSINNANTRTKCNQDSLLLLQIVYKDENRKLYGLDRLIKLTTKDGKSEEQLRSLDDCSLDLSKLVEKVHESDFIESVNFYTENSELNIQIEKSKESKFKKMTLKTITQQSEN